MIIDDTNYYMPAQGRLLQLMRDTFGEKFNVYYDGMPDNAPPESAYPCCVVHKQAGTVQAGATGQDAMRSQINIHFLLNGSDTVNASGDVNLTKKKLENMIEARDPATGQWRTGTAMYALATQLTLGSTTVELDRDFQYDMTYRQELPTIVECVIQIIAVEKIPVPVRN